MEVPYAIASGKTYGLTRYRLKEERKNERQLHLYNNMLINCA